MPKRRPKVNDPFARNKLKLIEVEPKTDNQKQFFDEYSTGKHLFCHGCPGTGKSFLGCYLAVKQIMVQKNYGKIIIIRSAVPTRDIGHLPGSIEEKTTIYEDPYAALFGELFGRQDAYDILKSEGVIEFITTSFLRGLTFSNAIVLVDEIQN